jgi:hypothetical protein
MLPEKQGDVVEQVPERDIFDFGLVGHGVNVGRLFLRLESHRIHLCPLVTSEDAAWHWK